MIESSVQNFIYHHRINFLPSTIYLILFALALAYLHQAEESTKSAEREASVRREGTTWERTKQE